MSTVGSVTAETPRMEQYPEMEGGSNPATSLGHLSGSTLSMRRKKHRKRTANAHHNCNFHAGFVPVTEDVLHRSGIRGRKRYFLYCTLGILLVVALVNTMVTAWLLYLLRLTHGGVSGVDILTSGSQSVFRAFVPAYASSLAMDGAPLGARRNGTISLTSRTAPLHVTSFHTSGSSANISLDGSDVTITADSLRVRSRDSKDWISLDLETAARHSGLDNFEAESITTERIVAQEKVKDLYLETPLKGIEVKGSEGVEINSKENIEVKAKDILLQAQNAVVVQSKHSVYIGPNLPTVITSRQSSRSPSSKLCVCGSGRVFLVEVSGPTGGKFACNVGTRTARKICGQ